MLSENSKEEMLDLLDKLDGQIYRLDSFIEDSEEINHALWLIIDRMISEINVTHSKIKNLVNYS